MSTSLLDRVYYCPVCRRQGNKTVLARPVQEWGLSGVLLKSRVTKLLRKQLTLDGVPIREELVVRVKCPRCRSQVDLPGRVLSDLRR